MQRFKSNTKTVDSDIEGTGLCAAHDLKQYELIIEYTGEIISNEAANSREKRYKKQVCVNLPLHSKLIAYPEFFLTRMLVTICSVWTRNESSMPPTPALTPVLLTTRANPTAFHI